MAKKAIRRASTRGGINYNETLADLAASVRNLEIKLKAEGLELPEIDSTEVREIAVVHEGRAVLPQAR